MNDHMLDTLLEAAREPEPRDDLFVQSVMRKVSPPSRPVVSNLRRPVVAGLAAATLLAGGAVAAMVGSLPQRAERPAGAASVEIVTPPPAEAPRPAQPAEEEPVEDGAGASEGVEPAGSHATSVIDPNTGLELTIDSYTDTVEAGMPHQVKIGLRNTGGEAVDVPEHAEGSCLLKLVVFALDGTADGDRADHACGDGASGPVVLAPGEKIVDHVEITLPSGEWGLVGMCNCPGTEAEKLDLARSLPSRTQVTLPQLLDVELGGRDVGLTTSPLRVLAV